MKTCILHFVLSFWRCGGVPGDLVQALRRCKTGARDSLTSSSSGDTDNLAVSVSQETTPSDSSSSAPPPRKRPALLSYARPSVQSDTSAASPDATLAAYITVINQDDFNPDDRPNIYAEQKYLAIRPLIAKLFCIPATSAPVERVFSQGGIIMRPHRAKMGDDVLEMLMHLRCNGN